MAIGYINMSANGKASPVDMERYIERTGKYAKGRGGQAREDLVATGSGNLPKWAKDAEDFWKAEDEYRKSVEKKAERDRARREEKGEGKETKRREVVRCRRVIIALPAELDHAQQQELLESYLKENFPQNAYTWAIHDTAGKLSGERNPHAHVLVCQQEIDPQKPEPDRDKYFSRRGGYHADKRLSGADRRGHLEVLKQNWEKSANRALENARQPGRVKMGRTPGMTPAFHLGERAVMAAARNRVDGRVPEEKENRAVEAWKSIKKKNILERHSIELEKERKAIYAERDNIEKTKNPDRLGLKGWFSRWGFFPKWREMKEIEYTVAYEPLQRKVLKHNQKQRDLDENPQAVTQTEELLFEVRINKNLYDAGRRMGAKTREEKIWDAKSPEEQQAELARQAAARKAAEEKRQRIEKEKREKAEIERRAEKAESLTKKKEYTAEEKKELRPLLGQIKSVELDGYHGQMIMPRSLFERIRAARIAAGLDADPEKMARSVERYGDGDRVCMIYNPAKVRRERMSREDVIETFANRPEGTSYHVLAKVKEMYLAEIAAEKAKAKAKQKNEPVPVKEKAKTQERDRRGWGMDRGR